MMVAQQSTKTTKIMMTHTTKFRHKTKRQITSNHQRKAAGYPFIANSTNEVSLAEAKMITLLIALITTTTMRIIIVIMAMTRMLRILPSLDRSFYGTQNDSIRSSYKKFLFRNFVIETFKSFLK